MPRKTRNEALRHAEALESLIDGDERDSLGRLLAPIARYLRKKAKEHVPNGLKVRRLVRSGELGEFKTVGEALDAAADAMDKCEAHEIVGGGILFEGEDGRWYTVTVEAVVGEASKEFVKDVLAEAEAEGE
jgi:hypothetical protein